MDRRWMLSAFVGILLGGCTEMPTAGTDDSGAAGRTADRDSTDEQILDAIRVNLEENGIEVRSLVMESSVSYLEYEARSTESGLKRSRQVVDAFERGIERGWDAIRIRVTLTDSDGSPKATYRIERWWVKRYANHQISGYELARRISHTIERLSDC